MAGYITKPGYQWQGEIAAGVAAGIPNGAIVTITGGKYAYGAADANTKFLCVEVGAIYDGLTGVRFMCTALNKNYYFAEQNFEIDDTQDYNYAELLTANGELLRAHPLNVGDEFIVDLLDSGTTYTAGTEYTLLANGKIGTASV